MAALPDLLARVAQNLFPAEPRPTLELVGCDPGFMVLPVAGKLILVTLPGQWRIRDRETGLVWVGSARPYPTREAAIAALLVRVNALPRGPQQALKCWEHAKDERKVTA